MTSGDAFSRNLITALREQDGLIPLSEAFKVARRKTMLDTSSQNAGARRQTPVMKSNWSGNDLVLGTPSLEKVSALPESIMHSLSAEACYLKATNLVQAGDLDAAVKQYQQAVTIDPKYADALADYGAVLSIKGDYKGAGDLYQKAIASKPNDALFHANYARVLDKMHLADRCMEELRAAYNLDGKDRVVLTALAGKALEADRPERAVRFLSEAVKLYPTSSTLHERLSYAFIKTGDVDQAVGHAREAAKDEPRSVSARLNLGSCLMMQGDAKDALAAYKEAVDLAPQNADAHWFLAKTKEGLGDRPGAKKELECFLKLAAPGDSRAQAAHDRLTE